MANHDWPSVLADIHASLYGEFDPVPVDVDDLGALVAARPQGSVSTKLAWNELDAEGFERLVFNLISDAQGYENPQWLMNVNAADRGRDLSVDRVIEDSLSGVSRQRVIVQCKHWQSKPVAPRDVTDAITSALLWEPPVGDEVIIATSGRFTQDAVSLIERRQEKRERPVIQPWAESHLESFLARRADLVAEFRLRSPR